LRDRRRLFGIRLPDPSTGWPFILKIERDLSVRQQPLDLVIVRRGSSCSTEGSSCGRAYL
jgi:hypothetical protein